jgi:hypothetical protein
MSRAAELTIDARLEDWKTVREQYGWTGLLVGNGASRAVWKGFNYASLLEVAQNLPLTAGGSARLSRDDLAVFSALHTTNFETVLASLSTAQVVGQALNLDVSAQRVRYESVQRALVAAVRSVHLPWISDTIAFAIQEALARYSRIYTTNYDLLLYWASMREGRGMLRDLFWSGPDNRFDLANTRIFTDLSIPVMYYLHGGLHLVRAPSGEVKKLTSERGKVLDQFGAILEAGWSPLVVTEGTAEDKLASIRRSDYLSFAYLQFTQHQGPLVIFGHRLAESDTHIVRVMREWEEHQPIAISLRRSDQRSIIARKAELHKLLGRDNLIFFDAATHPLGAAALRVPRAQLPAQYPPAQTAVEHK